MLIYYYSRKAVGRLNDSVDLYAIGRARTDPGFIQTLPNEDADPLAKAARIWKDIEAQVIEVFSSLSGQNPGWNAKEGFLAEIKDFQEFETESLKDVRSPLLALQTSMSHMYRFLDSCVIPKYEILSLDPTYICSAKK